MAAIESSLGAVAKVGPYFTAVSLIPSAVFAAGIYILVSARPWTGSPNWAAAVPTAADASWQALLVWALLAAFLALLLHPLQYSFVQLLEGYWGSGPFALWAAEVRLAAWLGHVETLQRRSARGESAYDVASADVPTRESLAGKWTQYEADRALSDFPEEQYDLMPTRLGNILRRHEERAGRPYDLSGITILPHLGLLAPPEHVSYLSDQRTQLDLAVRLCMTMAGLTVLTTSLLSFCGWWELLALIPVVLTAMLYRGACVVAHHYGNSIEVLVDLNRRRLYEALGINPPENPDEERAQNLLLSELLEDRYPTLQADPADEPSRATWRRVFSFGRRSSAADADLEP